MNRLFGKAKEKEPPPTLTDTTNKIQERGDTLDTRIRQLDAKLAEFKKQLKTARSPAAKSAILQRAQQTMKQKKMYESQRDQLSQQQMNIESVAFTSENLKDTVDTVKTLQQTSKEMKKQFKTNKAQLDINKIDSLMDDIHDFSDMNQEIQEALGQSYMTPDIDEDDLMAELDALDEDMALEAESGIPSYLQEPDLPEAPQEPVQAEQNQPQALRS